MLTLSLQLNEKEFEIVARNLLMATEPGNKKLRITISKTEMSQQEITDLFTSLQESINFVISTGTEVYTFTDVNQLSINVEEDTKTVSFSGELINPML